MTESDGDAFQFEEDAPDDKTFYNIYRQRVLKHDINWINEAREKCQRGSEKTYANIEQSDQPKIEELKQSAQNILRSNFQSREDLSQLYYLEKSFETLERIDTKKGMIDRTLLFENKLCVQGYRVFQEDTRQSTKIKPRSYVFSDQDFRRAVPRISSERLSKRMANFMEMVATKWHDVATFSDFILAVNNMQRTEKLMPLQAQTVVNWITKLCIQQYMVRWVIRLGDGKLVDDMEEGHERNERDRIQMRAAGLRDLLARSGWIPAPMEGTRDRWAWDHWRKVYRNEEMQMHFLKQLVLLGPDKFLSMPVHFGTGGRHGDTSLYVRNPMTIEKLNEFIDILRRSPGKSLAAASNGNAATDTVKDADGTSYRGRHVRSFLNRLGIKRRRAHALDSRVSRPDIRAEIENFMREIQERHVFGDQVDGVWMDETTLSLHPTHKWAWSFQGQSTVTAQNKHVGGGDYNMMLAIGIIGNVTFLHYIVYKPQHANMKAVGKWTFIPVGRKAKVNGTYGSILNYFFGGWGTSMSDEEIIDIASRKDYGETPFPLAHFMHKLRVEQKRTTEDLYFFWDNFSGHFAQNTRQPDATSATPPASRYNPAFSAVPRLFENIADETYLSMIYLPRHMPQFNPCERVFAHLKSHIAINTTDSSSITQQTLLSLVDGYMRKISPNGILNVIRGCHYKTRGQTATRPPPPPPAPSKEELYRDLDAICNDPDLSRMPQYRTPGQVACHNPKTGLISRYLGTRWHVLSQQAVLFDTEQRAFVMDTMRGRRDANGAAVVQVYSGYGNVAGLERGKNRVEAQIKLILDMFNNPGEIEMSLTVVKDYVWFAICLLTNNKRWVLQARVFREGGATAMKWTNATWNFGALLKCGKITDPLKVNMFVGQITTTTRGAFSYTLPHTLSTTENDLIRNMRQDTIKFYRTS